MITKTIEQVDTDLKLLFDIDNENYPGTMKLDNVFMIDKQQLDRSEVLHKLSVYFKKVLIENGYLIVNNITFVHTKFEIKEGKPPQQ